MALRKLDLMHRLFGRCEGHICGECKNFACHTYHSKRYRKCKVYGETNSEASDWARRWTACGMFNQPYDGFPIIERKRQGGYNAKVLIVDEPLDGQISLEV